MVENTTQLKADCYLVALGPTMEPIGQVNGVAHIFEHEYMKTRFWHCVVDVVTGAEFLLKLFEAGQKADIKIQCGTDDGRTGLAKLLTLRVRDDEPGACWVSLTGITELKKR